MARDYGKASNIIYNPLEAAKNRRSSVRDYRQVSGNGVRDYRNAVVQPEQEQAPAVTPQLPDFMHPANAIKSVSVQPSFLQPQVPVMNVPGQLQQFAKTAPVPELTGPEKARQLPIIGPALRGLDVLQKATEPASKIAEQFIVPGAGLNNVGAFTGAAESALAKFAPNLAPKAGEFIARNVSKIPGINMSAPTATKAVTGAIKETAAGIPLGAGQSLAAHPEEGLKGAAENAAFGGAIGGTTGFMGPVAKAIADRTGLTSKLAAFFTRNSRVNPEVEQATRDVFENHVPQAAPQRPLGVSTGPLRNASNEQYINKVMDTIKPIVTERMTPPLENPNALAKWLQPHLDTSLNQIRKLPYNDMVELANEVKNNMSMYDVAVKVAKQKGYDLDKILANQVPNIRQQAERLRMGRAAGAIEPPTQNVRVGVSTEFGQPKARVQEPSFKANEEVAATSSATPLDRPMVDDATKVRSTSPKASTTPSDEVHFAERLRKDETLPEEVRQELERNKITAPRTTNESQRAAAAKMIEKNGIDKVYSDLMSRRGHFNPVETTAAQMLARHFSDSGDVQRAIDLVGKTGKGGREMGQAIQALTQWNKLSQEGALLAAEKQLNRRVKDVDMAQTLTPEQAQTVMEPAKGLEGVQAVNQMASDIAKLIASKKPGEALTDAETALLKRFQEDSKKVNEQIKPFLQDKIKRDAETIKKVRSIQPRDRTRDQVKNYLQAQADQARAELRSKRNIGFAQKVGTPDIVLYSKIAASHIANGAVKFADFAEQMVKEGITDKLQLLYTNGVKQFRKDNGLPSVQDLDRLVNKAIKDRQMDEETAHSLQALASEIGFYTDQAKVELTQDLQRAIKNIGKSTLGEKAASIHTQGMLLNIPSFGRNVIGTIQQLTLEKMAKVAASPIDWTISKLVTGERTVHLFSNNQEGFVRNFMAGSKSSWNGVDPRGMLDAYGLQPNVFKGKYNPFKYTEKLLSASLGGIDGSAYYSAYGDVMATYATELGKRQGLSSAQIKASLPDLMNQLDERVHGIADEAGLYANLQDETILSMMSTGLKKGLNMPTNFAFRKARESGLLPESMSLEGFGLGDIVLKFAKTPANLVMRGLDYSPLGFMRSLGQLISLIPKQGRVNFNQRNFSMTLGRAITGSLGLTGLGYYLAKNGILTGASSADADVRSLQEQSGQAPYQINWSALGRFIYSGLDPEAAKPQPGDQMMKYDWLQPAAISVSMGVDAALYEPKDNEGMAARVGHSLLSGMRSVLENPMLQGVKKISDAFGKLKTQQDSSGFTDIVKGVPASFIPSVAGQVRRGEDNLKRETRAEGFWEGALNQIKNKIPGMQNKLPVSYDSLGRPREYVKGSQTGFMQYLNALTNPAQMSKYAVSPDAKIVLDLMNETNDTSVLPRVAAKSIQVTDPETKKKKSITLTGDQYSRLQQDVGTRVREEIMKAQEYFANPNVSSEHKIKRMTTILTKQGTKARNTMKDELGYKK